MKNERKDTRRENFYKMILGNLKSIFKIRKQKSSSVKFKSIGIVNDEE